MATAARRVATSQVLGDDIATLRLKWRAALLPGQALPPYDEVVLGSLGRLADHLCLIGGEATAAFRILNAGRAICDWLGVDSQGKAVADLPADCALSLSELLSQALTAGEPTQSRAHRVRNGLVETYDVLALPLSCRWGSPMIAVYAHEQASRYNLIDTIFRSTDEGIFALAALRDANNRPIDFQIVAVNGAASRLLRRSETQLQWRRLSELQNGLNSPNVAARLLRVLGTGQGDQFELTVPLDGDAIHLKVAVASTGDLLSLTLIDIGDLKQREASFRLLFDVNPVPMWLYDPVTLKFLSVNDAAVGHYGYSREEFLSKTLLDIWPPDERELHREVARAVNDSYQSDRTWRHVRSDGGEIEVLTYAQHLTFDKHPTILVAVVDVTERKQAEARIEYMAHHDALTGLANRVQFHARLNDELVRRTRRGDSLAVLCLDLDHFKGVNDSLGHPIGDLLLKSVAERLHVALREIDVVARLGGDEFAIIMPQIASPDDVSSTAGKLIDVLSERFDVDGHDVIVGASIGIALAPDDGDTVDTLLRNADMALYRAKGDGRGKFHFFEAAMDKRIRARRALELDLRKAYANNEFELHYQPLVELRTQSVSAFEALLRWRHPERGMIPPGNFIPLAEEIGLIVPLGEWVLRKACAEAATWPAEIKIAVNLSPVQFRNRGLIQAVLSALAYSRLSPSRLELEITESVLLGENDLNLSTLHRLRELGVRISMDDFGTGYSSLSYLRSFPFDKIKIDKSFVRELTERPDCMAIIRAVAGLGASLGIATTAEGVETREQLERLCAEGCTEVQGFFFSPPRPPHELKALLNDRRIANVA